MGTDDSADRRLATLPNGAHVVSTLLTDLSPPQHVYRVVSPTGTVIREFSTLPELNEFVLADPGAEAG